MLLVVWTKVNFQCTALQRPKIELIAKKGYSWITESTKSVWKCFSLPNSHQKIVLELWQYLNKWRTSLNESRNHIGKKWAQVHELGKSKSWNGCIFANAHQKTWLKLNQTFVVQVDVSSKPCFGPFEIVPRYFRPKSFSKRFNSCMSQQKWFDSSERNFISKVKFWTSAKTTSTKKLDVE